MPYSSATTSSGSPAREQPERVLQPSPATDQDGLAESACRIDHDLGDLISRQPDQAHIALIVELQASQIATCLNIRWPLRTTTSSRAACTRPGSSVASA